MAINEPRTDGHSLSLAEEGLLRVHTHTRLLLHAVCHPTRNSRSHLNLCHPTRNSRSHLNLFASLHPPTTTSAVSTATAAPSRAAPLTPPSSIVRPPRPPPNSCSTVAPSSMIDVCASGSVATVHGMCTLVPGHFEGSRFITAQQIPRACPCPLPPAPPGLLPATPHQRFTSLPDLFTVERPRAYPPFHTAPPLTPHTAPPPTPCSAPACPLQPPVLLLLLLLLLLYLFALLLRRG